MVQVVVGLVSFVVVVLCFVLFFCFFGLLGGGVQNIFTPGQKATTSSTA